MGGIEGVAAMSVNIATGGCRRQKADVLAIAINANKIDDIRRTVFIPSWELIKTCSHHEDMK